MQIITIRDVFPKLDKDTVLKHMSAPVEGAANPAERIKKNFENLYVEACKDMFEDAEALKDDFTPEEIKKFSKLVLLDYAKTIFPSLMLTQRSFILR